MARAAVTPITAKNAFANAPGAGVAEKAADATEFNSFVNTGREILIVRNANAGTKTLKLKSSAGTQIGATLVIPASKTVAIGPFPTFEQFGEVVNVDANSAEVFLTVVSIPNTSTSAR